MTRTFLVTAKMHPELARRIRAQLGGSRQKAGERHFRRGGGLSFMRVAPFLVMALVGTLFVLVRRSVATRLDRHRDATRAAVDEARAPLRDVDRAILPEVESWIERAAAGLEADPATALDGPEALDEWLRRPGIYVRGTKEELSRRSTHPAAAAASIKDAFLYCLYVPPASRAEQDLLARVRGVNFGGTVVEDRTKAARRLHELELGLALADGLEGPIKAARNEHDLERLELRVRQTPVAEALQAARAEVLIVVVDDPPGARPTEPENESPHPVRALLVDLARREVSASVARRVELAGWSNSTKIGWAGSVQGCALAWDVRDAL